MPPLATAAAAPEKWQHASDSLYASRAIPYDRNQSATEPRWRPLWSPRGPVTSLFRPSKDAGQIPSSLCEPHFQLFLFLITLLLLSAVLLQSNIVLFAKLAGLPPIQPQATTETFRFHIDPPLSALPFNASLDGCPLSIILTSDPQISSALLFEVKETLHKAADDSHWQHTPISKPALTRTCGPHLCLFGQKLQGPVACDFTDRHKTDRNNRWAITEELHGPSPGRIFSYGSEHKNRKLLQDLEESELLASSPDARHSQDTRFQVMRKHKFALAFENANMVDYVTEQYWHALAAGVVPVYFGAPNFREHFLPHPKAAIMASEFPTVQDLADHLAYLSSNETAYNEYLAWKTLPFRATFQALLDAEFENTPLCRLAMFLKGRYMNPLNALGSRRRYTGRTVLSPRIGERTGFRKQ